MLGSSRSTAGSEGWEHAHMFSTCKQKREREGGEIKTTNMYLTDKCVIFSDCLYQNRHNFRNMIQNLISIPNCQCLPKLMKAQTMCGPDC